MIAAMRTSSRFEEGKFTTLGREGSPPSKTKTERMFANKGFGICLFSRSQRRVEANDGIFGDGEDGLVEVRANDVASGECAEGRQGALGG